jgi:hypothetical protein
MIDLRQEWRWQGWLRSRLHRQHINNKTVEITIMNKLLIPALLLAALPGIASAAKLVGEQDLGGLNLDVQTHDRSSPMSVVITNNSDKKVRCEGHYTGSQDTGKRVHVTIEPGKTGTLFAPVYGPTEVVHGTLKCREATAKAK